MQRSTFRLRMAAALCLLLFCVLLLVGACGNYSSPGSPPQATPTSGGYSLISVLDNELQWFLSPLR